MTRPTTPPLSAAPPPPPPPLTGVSSPLLLSLQSRQLHSRAEKKRGVECGGFPRVDPTAPTAPAASRGRSGGAAASVGGSDGDDGSGGFPRPDPPAATASRGGSDGGDGGGGSRGGSSGTDGYPRGGDGGFPRRVLLERCGGGARPFKANLGHMLRLRLAFETFLMSRLLHFTTVSFPLHARAAEVKCFMSFFEEWEVRKINRGNIKKTIHLFLLCHTYRTTAP
uniref:Uncharacterized protein n=1 Tax=Oryza meridionalis TaxID=40149 RepID=A0A0E0EGI3_9ORYZ